MRNLTLTALLVLGACAPKTPTDEGAEETDSETTDSETTDSETTDSETTDSETTDSETTDSETGDGDGDGDMPDACALVLDQTYSSQEQLECGLGPNGVELCNWTIGFEATQYHWSFSDVGQSDDYSCAGLDLLRVPEGTVLGTVSADGSLLTWDGVLYDRVN